MSEPTTAATDKLSSECCGIPMDVVGNNLSGIHHVRWCIECGKIQFGTHCSTKPSLLERLKQQLDRMKLERDVLALNWGLDEPRLYILMNGDDVYGVSWEEDRTASQPSINLPAYYEQLAEATNTDGGN